MTPPRQANRKRWTFTLPVLFGTMVIAFCLMNARFLPLAAYTRTQNSRMTAWEGGVPSQSYAKTLQKHQKLGVQSSVKSGSSSSSSFLKTTYGKGWQMWNRVSILHDDLDLKCNWNDYIPFVPHGRQNPKPVPFCAHPLSDDQFVSSNVVKRGRHLECDALPKFLSQSLERSKQPKRDDDHHPPIIYIDIGANIGTCVMQMLLTTNATIMAFEPHPFNLFVMTSTFMQLEKKDRDRIHLFPIALGAESNDSTIHMASDNRGHAVVSKVIKINRRATFLPPMPIRVEPLDSVLKESTEVHLMKMDAQGFECYIFDGMRDILKRTMTVFFELERQVLNGFDRCSPQLLWDKFLASGFEMHVGGPNRPATKEVPDKGKANIVALRHE